LIHGLIYFDCLVLKAKNIFNKNDVSSGKEISQALVFQIPVIISGGCGCC